MKKTACPICGGTNVFHSIWDGAAKMTCKGCWFECSPIEWDKEGVPKVQRGGDEERSEEHEIAMAG